MRLTLSAIAAALAILLAACGGGNGGSVTSPIPTPSPRPTATHDPTPTPSPKPTPTANPTPTPTPTPTATPTPCTTPCPIVASPNPIHLGGSYPTTIHVTVSVADGSPNAIFDSTVSTCHFMKIATVTPKTAPGPSATFELVRFPSPPRAGVSSIACTFVINDAADGTTIQVPVTATWPTPSPTSTP